MRIRYPLGVAMIIVALTVSACSDGSDRPAASSSSPSATPSASGSAHAGMDMSGSTGSVEAGDPSDAWGAAPSSGVESALRLEALLGQHAVLAADMMRARVRADADLAQSANAALTDNTAAMRTVLEPVAGADGAEKFAKVWAEHIRQLFAYAGALSTKNAAGQRTALEQLTSDETDLAQFFSAASAGRLPEKDAVGAVKQHIDHLVAGADAYAKKDYATAAEMYRMSYGHTFDLGGTIARTILPAAVGKELDEPETQLRATLTKTLGEHVALVIASMRSAAGDSADFSAMGDALNGNTRDLAGAIDSLFGAKAAKGFQQYWADHVDELMTYTVAAVKGDTAAQRDARLELRDFEKDFGGFMNTATENRLGAKALVNAFVSHDRMLLAEIDAYAAKDFQQAQDLSYQAYSEMFAVSKQLSGAIGATLAGQLPRGGSQTGGGGLAPHGGTHP